MATFTNDLGDGLVHVEMCPPSCGCGRAKGVPAEMAEELRARGVPFRREKAKPRRNAPCPCGSGLKTKRCACGN